MKITLQINGREQSFSEEELIAKLKELEEFKRKESKATTKQSTVEVARKPTEGKKFEVDPNSIDQKLFKEKRRDSKQEAVRQFILEAFEEVKNNPGKYSKKFYTLIPEKTWVSKTVGELKKMASKKGDHIANWVEQVLEWAQRIQNGETWEDLCNKADTANWYRLVVWKEEHARLIGGSTKDYRCPATDVGRYNFSDFNNRFNTVPLIVLYK